MLRPHRQGHPVAQVLAGDLGAVGQGQHAVLDAVGDEVLLQLPVVLQIAQRVAPFGAVERRLGDVEMAALHQLRHLPEKEGEQEGADVAAVDIGVGHDDDLVVPQFADIELFAPDAGPQRGDQRADLGRAQHLVEARPLDVQDLASERQNRLEPPVAPLFGGAAGGIALDDEKLRQSRIAFLAIGQLAGQGGHV